MFPVAERLLDSTLQMLRNVPHLAVIPLVILWFGIDEAAKVFLVSVGVFFPIYLNTFHGVRTVDPGLIEMARVYGLSRWELYWRVILPGALPSILVGLRFALGLMWLTLIVAETISATSGIGYMTMNAREFLQTDVVLLGHHHLCAARQAGRCARRACSSVGLWRGIRLIRPRVGGEHETGRWRAIRSRAPSGPAGPGGSAAFDVVEAPRLRRAGGGEGEPVTFEGVDKSFGERRVLAGLDLHIARASSWRWSDVRAAARPPC